MDASPEQGSGILNELIESRLKLQLLGVIEPGRDIRDFVPQQFKSMKCTSHMYQSFPSH